MIEIIPAILTDNQEEFTEQLKLIENFGAESAQIDFTDSEFVGSATLLPDELDAFVLSRSILTFEAHLMVEDPEQHFATLFTLGFKRIATHWETLSNPHDILEQLAEYGMEAGIAINPETDLQKIEPFIKDLDFVLFMSVVPGEQGHPFEEQVLEKVHIEKMHGIKNIHPHIPIEIDGGVSSNNIREVVQAGAERICIGSAIWQANNPKQAYEELFKLANESDKKSIRS